MLRMSPKRLSATTRYRAVVLIAAALPTAIVVAGCGSALAPGAAPTPPLLRIAQGLAGAADGARVAGSGGYVLVGQLPDTPTTGATYRWTTASATADDVARVSTAFGITATPVRAAHGWKVVGANGTVLVRDGDGQQWVFLRSDQLDCPPVGLDIDAESADTGVVCARATGGTTTTTPGTTATGTPAPIPAPAPVTTAQAVTKAQALALAQPILTALSISGTVIAVAGDPAQVSVDPTIDGLAVFGLTSTVGVDRQGIASASGRLLTPAKADTYPLRTAQAAFDDLKSQPVPLLAELCPYVLPSASVGGDQCGSQAPIKITGATYGLMLVQDGGNPILAPAWRFSVSGWEDPLSVLGVDPKFITTPTPDVSNGSGSGSGGSGDGGSAQPGSPGAPPTAASPPSSPTEPGALPAPGDRHSRTVVVAVPAQGGDELALVSFRGACDTSPEARVVNDDEAKLVVSVTVLGPPAGTVCTAQAVSFVTSVRLHRPLGARVVIDSATGKGVTIDANYDLPK